MTDHRTPSTVQPVDGPTFRAAVRLQPGGTKRRRVLALVAAWQDAEQPSTSAFDIAARLGLDFRQAQRLLERLEADGYVEPSRSTASRRYPRYRIAAAHLPAELQPQEMAR